jgi:RES domain
VIGKLAKATWRLGTDHPSLSSDPAIGYKAGNALARAVIARGVNGIIYPSLRNAGGICFAVLWPHAVQSVAQGSVYRLTWAGKSVPTVEQISQ